MSTWLIYTDGLREHLDGARHRQARTGDGAPRQTGSHDPAPPTAAGLRTDLALALGLARAEIRRLREDNDKLRQRLRLQLSAELDRPDPAQLITRVAALESQTRQLLAERNARATEAHQAQHRVAELEDDLTACESLRRAIRQANR